MTKEVIKSTDDSYAYTYSYDSKGNLIKETSKSSSFTYSITYKYDSKGNRTKEVFKSSDRNYTATYKYDSNGNMTKATQNDSSDGISTATFKYKKLSSPIFDKDGITLTDYQYTYDGKEKEPNVFVTVTTLDGPATLFKGADYTVTYSNNINPGKAKAVIKFYQSYEEVPVGTNSVTIYFDILPAKASGLKVTKTTESSAVLKWNEVPKAEKYIVYSYDSSSGKYVKVKTVTANKATINDLKSGTTYKFCVRAVAGGLKGAYSAKVTAKTN